EEQPFDRFYRRAATATATEGSAASATLSTKTPTVDAPIPVTVETSKAPGKRIIYVTMPAARNVSAARETALPVREQVQPVHEMAHTAYEPVGSRVIEDYSAQQGGDQALIEEFFPRKKRSPQVVRL